MLHVAVVCLQVHAVILQSVEPMNDMGTARIDVAVAVLIFGAVIDIFVAFKEIG